MSAEVTPVVYRAQAAPRPLWLRLRYAKSFTLAALMVCLALLWVSPFLWMLSSAFSAGTFSADMASVLPRLPDAG